MTTIFVVEDDSAWQQAYLESLPGHQLIQATTGGEGWRLFHKHQREIDIIVLDGYLAPGDPEGNTLRLGDEIRRSGFSGPVIAASNSDRMQSSLLGQGRCNYAIENSKEEVPGLIAAILRGLQPLY